MYRRIYMILTALAITAAGYAQVPLDDVLRSIEQNNITLQAQRAAVEAKELEVRMGNSLEDLSVSYTHLWGSPSALGKTGEVEVTQAFDFPTAYIYRNRLAGNLSEQFQNEYVAARQQLLLEAKELYIELQYLRQQEYIMNYRIKSQTYLKNLYQKRYDEGDATLLEKTKFEHELLLIQESAADCRLRVIEVETLLTAMNGGQKLEIPKSEEPFETVKPFEQTLEDYRTYAPMLLGFRLQEAGAGYDLKVSRSQSVPKLELGYKHEYATGNEEFNGVIVGLSVPIFSNRHNVKRAKALQTVARLESQAAEVECEAVLAEMYEKAGMLENSLDRYDDLPEMKEYYQLLVKALNAGEINVVEYFSEVYSYYDVLEAKSRIEMEYRMALARINMIYL